MKFHKVIVCMCVCVCVCVSIPDRKPSTPLKKPSVLLAMYLPVVMWWFPHQYRVPKWVLQTKQICQSRAKVDPEALGLPPPRVPQNKSLAVLQWTLWSFCKPFGCLYYSDVVSEFVVGFGSLKWHWAQTPLKGFSSVLFSHHGFICVNVSLNP